MTTTTKSIGPPLLPWPQRPARVAPILRLIAGARLDAPPPTAIVILKPDHVRGVNLFVRWFHVPAHGPWLFWGGEAPEAELAPVRPGETLPGGLVAPYDGRGSMETPIYLPEQRAIVFADGMTAPGGVLLVSHGEPVDDRADFEAALEREPWSPPSGPAAR